MTIDLSLDPDVAKLVSTALRSQVGSSHVVWALSWPNLDLYERMKKLDSSLIGVADDIDRQLEGA